MKVDFLKCKNCGASLNAISAVNGVIECDYCHSKFTIPKNETLPAALNFLRIGEHELDICEFEKAYESFRKAAQYDQNEPEAYWGMALAEFKVQYIKDIKNNRLQPICHEISYKAFVNSQNYLMALRLASVNQRAEYIRKAQEIDSIRKEFYNLEKSGLDYDCFICVKVTDDNGFPTEDSKDADYIYRLLRGKGYTPFYSEYEIRNRVGVDYEALILYALYTSETMLVVCRNEGYLQTPWVKNEYSRFLKLVNDEQKENDSVTFVYYKNPIERLPGKNGRIQGIDFCLRGADSEILKFVETHTPKARAKREEEKRKKEDENAELRRQLEEQRKRQEELERRLANSSGGSLSDEDLLVRIERARQEKERKAKEEVERLRREEAERQRRAKEEAERLQREKKRLEIIARAKKYSIIEDGCLKKYRTEEEGAFGGDKFDECIIPEGVKIIDSYSVSAGYSSITIPSSVKQVNDCAFNLCRNKLTVYYIGNVADWCGIDFLGDWSNPVGCNDDNELYINNKLVTDIIIPNSVTSIGSGAFYGCKNLKSITIPNSVTSIGSVAFFNCKNLKRITIPNSVKSIGYGAFIGTAYCSDKNNWVNDSLYIGKHLIEVDNKFSGSYIIKEGTLTIAGGAFMDCENLTNVIIPNSVTSIGESAFGYCYGLTNVIIPNSVTSIGRDAFGLCDSLKTVTIPNSVTSIDGYAFVHCKKLSIRCEAQSQPPKWDTNWNSKVGSKDRKGLFSRHKVKWGVKIK